MVVGNGFTLPPPSNLANIPGMSLVSKPILDTTSLDRAIENHERRAAAIKQIKQVMLEFPDLLQELQLGDDGQPDQPQPALKIPRGFRRKRLAIRMTNFDRVQKFFADTGNEWIGVPELAVKLGWSRGAVGHLMWTAHPNEFESRPVPGKKRKKLWRMKTVKNEQEE